MARKDYKNPSYKRPDHPSFKDKKHTLLIDSQGASNKEIKTESGTLRFEDGVAVLPDDTRAKDIYDELQQSKDPNVRALHPNQYALVENKPTVNPDPIHRYTFGYNRRFAERWEEIFGSDVVLEDDKEVKPNGRKVRKSRDTERGARELYTDA